jgi:hypothetical protein
MSDVYLGIDLGGSGSKLLLARGPGPATGPEPLWQHRIDGALTPGTLDALRATVHDGLARTATTVQAAGVTVPGIVDETTGVVRRSVNMPWLDGVSVPERFGALLGVPTVAVHDGRAAALAEARLGAGRGSDDVFVLALGTGVAGAHVVRGTVRTGAHDGAGEAGHVSLDPAGPRTSPRCGSRPPVTRTPPPPTCCTPPPPATAGPSRSWTPPAPRSPAASSGSSPSWTPDASSSAAGSPCHPPRCCRSPPRRPADGRRSTGCRRWCPPPSARGPGRGERRSARQAER